MENLADDIFLFVQLPILSQHCSCILSRAGWEIDIWDLRLILLFRCTPISFWLSSKMLHATNSRTVNEPSTTKYVQFQSGFHQTTDCLTPVNNSTVLLILEWHFWFFGSCSPNPPQEIVQSVVIWYQATGSQSRCLSRCFSVFDQMDVFFDGIDKIFSRRGWDGHSWRFVRNIWFKLQKA